MDVLSNHTIEADYPLGFRMSDTKILGSNIRNRHSVVLIGMKRVGISNFLRFFLNHKSVAKENIGDNNNHFFIPVDLNDLVEREIYPFWILTFKRIVDAVSKTKVNKQIKDEIEHFFLDSIQSKELLLVIDYIRKALQKIIEQGLLPTIFFIRFDRMRNHATKEFLYNLIGLKDATNHKLSYVFTTYRRLDHLSPGIFNPTSLSLVSNNIYLKPALKEDIEIIFETYLKRYGLSLSARIKSALFELVDGYVQFMQLSLIILNEYKKPLNSKHELFNLLSSDERMSLQSEELWESLNTKEKEVLVKINQGQKIWDADKEEGKYLWETGMVNSENEIFSPLFSYYLNHKSQRKILANGSPIEFSKKEYLLFNFLKDNLDQICEREAIIEAVWPEEEALGVSDWAIDRLVARLRTKLKKQQSPYEIVTIKTRGYKLVSAS